MNDCKTAYVDIGVWMVIFLLGFVKKYIENIILNLIRYYKIIKTIEIDKGWLVAFDNEINAVNFNINVKTTIEIQGVGG